MSIHILTADPKLIQQLEELLAGGQQSFSFYNELETLIDTLPRLKKTDKVFYDLQLESTLMAFDALRFGSTKTNLVAFEPMKKDEDGYISNCPKTAKHYFALSSDTRKAGVRLNQLLHEIDSLAAKKKRARKKAALKKAATDNNTSPASVPMPITLSRYLSAKSDAMQQLLVKIADLSRDPQFIFITGEDGADFELAAREINFRTNGDSTPLHIADPMRVEVDQIKKKVCREDTVGYCYLGLSYELGAMTIARLTKYLESLKDGKAGGNAPCFILGHVEDSESYLEDQVKDLIQKFTSLSEVVELPSMAVRRDDIGLIAQSIFTTLRTAHPFLMTRTLSKEAIDYLQDACEEYSYAGLVRNIRNAMALTERDTLTEVELKNFRDDSPTAQHLLESLADEKFFEDKTGVA